MPKQVPTFYYSVRTYGDGDKGVYIYRIKNNELISFGDVEVGWGQDEDKAVQRFIEEHFGGKFYTQMI